jgi:hypothetical protein
MHVPSQQERTLIGALCLLTCFWFATGCGKSAVDKSLESDARGYFCPGCKTRFYTEYSVIADVCPQCKSYDIQEVIGFVCSADSHVTLASRGSGAPLCEKCGQLSSTASLPRESQLKAWNAVRKSKAEVSP